MVFTRVNTDFATRLNIEGTKLDRVDECKLLGVWLTSDLKWERNTREMTRKAYSRMSMITKLKYVGVCQEDLFEVYIVFIRSLLEYCAVVWHSRLTKEQQNSLERVQKSCLRVILGEQYDGYENALQVCGLETLYSRREDRCLAFAKSCLKHPVHKRLFPLNPSKQHDLRDKQKFVVNFATASTYQDSTIRHTANQGVHDAVWHFFIFKIIII